MKTPPPITSTVAVSVPEALPESVIDRGWEKLGSINEIEQGNLTDQTKPEISYDLKETTPDENDMQSLPIWQIGSVPLEPWERTALKDYHALIHTPRGATRLLNTYRLVRGGVQYDEWDIFCGDKDKNGEFRIAMLLLASAAGYPAVVHKLFNILRELDIVTPLPTLSFGQQNDLKLLSHAWEQFKKTHDDTCGQGGFTLTKAVLGKWLNRVERFTF